MNREWIAIGLMSGTSLDGVDLACCHFRESRKGWDYRVEQAETIPYPGEWKERLASVESQSALDLALLDSEYGHLLGKLVKKFTQKYRLTPHFIASHGHTIFHQPGRRMTCQIGNGSAIAAETGMTVVCDFRSGDVALGGQGAPLVPIGDHYLFGDYACCLNLGGFANISYEKNGKRVAFDICPANIVLNRIASEKGSDYDKGGKMASGGAVHSSLLSALNELSYYSLKPPKSLGKEWVLSEFMPVLDRFALSPEDKLRTLCHHIGIQTGRAAGGKARGSILITGGGAFNGFLVEEIRRNTRHDLVIPDDLTVSFKEAIIFAFLGVLRMEGRINVLRSVTGAKQDHIGGAVCLAIP